MKTRTRFAVVCLFAVGIVSLYLWPSRTLHMMSSSDIMASSVFSDHGTLDRLCNSYFEALAHEAPVKPSSSSLQPLSAVTNHIEHLRIFNRCYLEKGFDLSPAAELAEKQLLPFFSGHPPAGPISGQLSFLREHKNKMRGRGIVVSISDAEVGRASNLLRVLNHLGNELPIEFVHLNELSDVSIKLLSYAAISSRALGNDQQISFKNVGRYLAPGFDKHFKGYNRKWFAAIFNSFQEMILMDADTVPYVAPSSLFELEGYKETGAYFFRDRELNVLLKKWKMDFFKGLLPSKKTPFGFSVDPAQLRNNFFLFNSKHVAESGLVIMDRDTHFSGLIIPVVVQYYRKTGKILYGDKDLFWLGQLISGNSKFSFHYNTAGAMGEIESTGEVCSPQIAHYGNNSLLWSNGGLTKCKKGTWIKDYLWYSSFRQQFSSIADLRESYNGPVSVSEIIIPAVLSDKNEPGTGQRPISNFNKVENRGCAATYYCANANDGGRLIILDKEEKERINTIIGVWNERPLYGIL
ncbi:hypothetical protein FT663_02269 [Candidozyma haemuli var. vulneris]|uniref:Uncharacterized protein n=1 Tax=Candidozyma haemuli TaxID=45357 RepID=A0A2V1ASA3_9ASCO|nr:hypothetical protein CXQ85_004202 [[Candida] haemuloni]KAF3991540.1 hypothetical protein FT662_01659 [[Candida] haemuloni var. vulneris]KAF3992482.1 hypothetical protein FT663_02269 [[Candida] haemuloni var. vulneris]PVH20698.1 hypothetical protein CXQ85_004202 [[Candida] haemuloni]